MKSETTKCEKCPYAFRKLVDNDLWNFHCKLEMDPKSCKRETDRMKIAAILNRNAEKRAAFEENVKAAKEILGDDKIKIISNRPEKKEGTNNEENTDFD